MPSSEQKLNMHKHKRMFFGVFVRLFLVLSDQSYLDHTISQVNIGPALIGIIVLVHPSFFSFFC